MADRFSGNTISFGLGERAALRAVNVGAAWPGRLSFTALYQGKSVEVESQLCGLHWTPTILAALAVGLAAGIPLDSAAKAIASVEPYPRSEEPTSELQSLMRLSYAGFCLKKK